MVRGIKYQWKHQNVNQVHQPVHKNQHHLETSIQDPWSSESLARSFCRLNPITSATVSHKRQAGRVIRLEDDIERARTRTELKKDLLESRARYSPLPLGASICDVRIRGGRQREINADEVEEATLRTYPMYFRVQRLDWIRKFWWISYMERPVQCRSCLTGKNED